MRTEAIYKSESCILILNIPYLRKVNKEYIYLYKFNFLVKLNKWINSMMPRKKLHKATLKGMIALYKKRKLPHPVSSAKGYMRGYNDVKRIRKGLKPLGPLKKK